MALVCPIPMRLAEAIMRGEGNLRSEQHIAQDVRVCIQQLAWGHLVFKEEDSTGMLNMTPTEGSREKSQGLKEVLSAAIG